MRKSFLLKETTVAFGGFDLTTGLLQVRRPAPHAVTSSRHHIHFSSITRR